MGKLALTDGAIQLGEAVVIGKAPEVTVRNDTMEYNADSYKTTEGSMLEDLLKKMPGVEVDSEGKITVNGKENQKVLIDGKSSSPTIQGGLQESTIENDRQSASVGQTERYGQNDWI